MLKNAWTIVGCCLLYAGAWASGFISGAAVKDSAIEKVISTRILESAIRKQTNEEKIETAETKEQEEA